jgi:hypothetical protein
LRAVNVGIFKRGPQMSSQQQFSDEQLSRIFNEATVYMCACPAQVAEQISRLRGLVRYQQDCDLQTDTDSIVHQSIAKAGLRTLQILEDCLDEILDLEGWDRTTLTMPEGLRKRRDETI